MKKTHARALTMLGALLLACAGGDARTRPTNAQVRWAAAEIGVIIHFDINVIAPDSFDYNRRETLPPLGRFNPRRLDTDQWIRSARAAGATYAVLVAKHGTGFCLWPTRAYGYHVGKTPWREGRGDIVRDFIASCSRYGIRPGIYYNTNVNTYLEAGPSGKVRLGPQSAYNAIVLRQLRELWTGYGPLFEIWFDGGVAEDSCGGIAGEVRRMIARYQPGALLFQGPPGIPNLVRWSGNEDGRAPVPDWSTADVRPLGDGAFAVADPAGDPDGAVWCQAEADMPGRKQTAWNGGWLWRAGQDDSVFPPDDLVERYFSSVGRNANMLIGMAIDSAGLCPRPDSESLCRFGDRIRSLFSSPLATVSGKGMQVALPLRAHPRDVNCVRLEEEIARGQRIRGFSVEAFTGGAWRAVATGRSVGHMDLERFPAVRADSLRLRITEARGEPLVREFSAYLLR